MADDWSLMASKDADTVPRMSITGNAASLLPNKISWFFDLRGPSIHVDTACSSGLTALDLACQSILSGNSNSVYLLFSITKGTLICLRFCFPLSSAMSLTNGVGLSIWIQYSLEP